MQSNDKYKCIKIKERNECYWPYNRRFITDGGFNNNNAAGMIMISSCKRVSA